jgi:hypothetical protein
MPPTVTVTGPVVAPLGTLAEIEDVPQLLTVVATVPLNFTVLVPCVEPKFPPEIVTGVPTGPEAGEMPLLLMYGVGVGVAVTVKDTALLEIPPTVTITPPVVAPEGTGTTMLVALQLVGVAAVPLNFTVLIP